MNTETLQKKGGLSYSFLAEHHQELAYAASSWAGFEQPQNTQAVASAVVADVMKHENHHEIDEIKNLEAVKSTKLRELSEAQFQCQMSGDKVNAGIISLAILVLSGAQGSAIKAALDAASIAIKSTTGGSDGPQTPEQKMQEALNHIRQDSHDLHTIFHKMHDEHHIHFNKKDLALSDKLNDQIEELTKQLEKDAENKALQKKLDDLVKQAAEVDQRLIEQAKAQGAKDEQVQELIKQAQDKMEDRKRESDKLSEEQIKVHKA